jgi:hypothetical protein
MTNLNSKNIKIDKNISIPSYKDYDFFYNNNYKLKLLKHMCIIFKLKKSGNKQELKERIYNYLKKTFFVLKIQNLWKQYILKKLLILKGPGLINRKICTNDVDFFSLDKIKDIDFIQFISYKEDNNIFGFDIISLYNLFIKSNNITLNPFTRKVLPNSLLHNIGLIKLYTKFIFKLDIVVKFDKIQFLSHKHEIEMYAITIFQDINNNGFYSNSNWLINLDINNLRIYLRELYDIWGYRASLTDDIRKKICFPTGNPFSPIRFHRLLFYKYEDLLHISLKIINNIVNLGIDNANKTLGCQYVLAALTLVNNQAAESMPWLYQSVM